MSSEETEKCVFVECGQNWDGIAHGCSKHKNITDCPDRKSLSINSGLNSSEELGAYNAGRDCAIEGQDGDNSDRILFETEKTRFAWDLGKRDGEAEMELAKEAASTQIKEEGGK